MSVFKCKMCGDTLVFNPGDTVCTCESCGTTQTLPRMNKNYKKTSYDEANQLHGYKNREMVSMRELLNTPELVNHPSKIAFPVGKDDSNNVIVADLAEMPHLLIAGSTGSGKTVFLNSLITTFLYRAKPSEVALVLIDTKKIEFNVYAGIPHLMKDVVTDTSQAVSCLRWAVSETVSRYQRMHLSSVKDFRAYNLKIENETVSPLEEYPRKMCQIVIIIDDLADLMMLNKKEVEALILRLLELSRPAGIHLVISTQIPSSSIVTGRIKAITPSRIAFYLPSLADYRTVLDISAVEKLSGEGEMLYRPRGYSKPVHLQGAYISDEEIRDAVNYDIQNNRGDAFVFRSKELEDYMNSLFEENSLGDNSSSIGDEYFHEAAKFCIEMGEASTSMLQRRFNLGFNRAARLIDQLEDFGVVGPQKGAKSRDILVDSGTFEKMYRELGPSSGMDDYFYEAAKLCIEMGKASASMLQRRFNIDFNRAARIIDQLEIFGLVRPMRGAKPREIVVDMMTFEEMYQTLMYDSAAPNNKYAESDINVAESLNAESSLKEDAEAEKKAQRWKALGKCQHCGGDFKGIFIKKCAGCGITKDY